MEGLSVSADGKRLVFRKRSAQFDVYVGRLQPDGRLQTPRRLTLDERNDYPMSWTSDRKAVIFASDRDGTNGIYRQALDQDQAEAIVTSPEIIGWPRVSPDGSWVLYSAFPEAGPASGRFMRVPISGGPPQLVMEPRAQASLSCSSRPSAECILYELTADQKQQVFWSFDPVRGRGHELFRITHDANTPLNGMLSPDGSRFAILKTDPHEGRIRLLALSGKVEREIEVKGWSNFSSLEWAADGKSLFVSCPGPLGATLLRVDLKGRVQPVWDVRGGQTWAIASPDGQYLAIAKQTVDRNAWMVENF